MYYKISVRDEKFNVTSTPVDLEGQSSQELYAEAVRAYAVVAETRPVGTIVTLDGEDGMTIMQTNVRTS